MLGIIVLSGASLGFSNNSANAVAVKPPVVHSVRTVPPAVAVAPTVAPLPLIPRQDREEFSSVGWTINPVSTLFDETITAANGTTWRVQRAAGKTTVVRSYVLNGRLSVDNPVVVQGDWALGVVTARDHRGGASADGATLVLASGSKRDRFVAIQGGKSKVVAFAGEFAIDAVANDGSMLFLVETVDPFLATYAIRKADLRTGLLAPGAIQNTDVSTKGVTVSTSDEPAMRGKPLDRLFGTDGWTYTLYYAEGHSYVHALDSAASGNGLCFDLPGSWNSKAATIRLKSDTESMTVVRKSKLLGRLLGTRPGVTPKISLG